MDTPILGTLTLTPIDEETLAKRAQADRAAFAAVYDHFFRRVYNYVRYRVGEAEAADDLTAQIFEQVLRHLPKYRPHRGLFAAWLFRIARNAIYDYLRQQRRHPRLSLEALEDQASNQLEPDQQVEERLHRAYLLNVIATLSEREQEIIALKFGAGLTNRQIADLLKLSQSNAGVILYRTLGKLRGLLHAEENR
ncbi:ECF RNA polymerase sigma factor ShbA [Thermoflexales bacterium]|nr:ECF RNA polymerase sigma factor ShbA [Thermoflexales bacterium]